MQKFIKSNILKQIISLYLLSLLALSGIRLFLYFRYFDHFSDLSTRETILSFLMGIRVDTIMLSTFFGIGIFLLLIPIKFTMSKYFRYFIQYLMLLILIAILIASFGDTLYFEYVGRHMSSELLTGENKDFIFLFDVIYKFYFLETILFILFILILIYIWKKIVSIDTKQYDFTIARLGFAFLILLLLVYSSRGKIIEKPFGISDAFVTDKISSGNLALNGFYSFYRSSGKKSVKHHHMDSKKAIEITQSMLKSTNTYFDDNAFPLSRKFKSPIKKEYNIVIILIESLTSRYVDSFNGNLGLGVSQEFDKLAQQGIKFTNFYANGQRSIEGVTSVFSGITVPTGLRTLGRGLELTNLTYIGKILKQNDYSTIAIRSAYRNSFRIGSIANLAGFDEYYGSEDLVFDSPEERTDIQPSFGKWDGVMYRTLNKKLNEIKKPFLSFSFSCNTHMLYRLPNEKWEKYKPHSDSTFKGFLNTMYYSDAMLGAFFEDAKKQPWFKDTIFFITADHTYVHSKEHEDEIKDMITFPKSDRLERFKVPLVIYAPEIFKPAVNDEIITQADIVPSIIDILGIDTNFSTLSNSIFDNVENRFAFLKGGNVEYLLTKDGQISHSLKNKIYSDNDNLEEKILSLDQTFSELVFKNQIIKKSQQ